MWISLGKLTKVDDTKDKSGLEAEAMVLVTDVLL